MTQTDIPNKLRCLKNHLREAMWRLHLYKKGIQTTEAQEPFEKVCQLLFVDKFHLAIWDEAALLQVEKLFQVLRPDEKHWGENLQKISERTRLVTQINDFFFAIISKEFSLDEVLKRLSLFALVPDSVAPKLKASEQLAQIRRGNAPSSEKMESFVNHLTQDLGV